MLNEPIRVGEITLKNRVVFPPLTTGYEERDGSIGEKSFNFYKRLAQGGAGYIILGDVAPINTASPTPKLVSNEQIPSFKALADACHEYGAKLGIQLFHPEYDAAGVGQLIMKCQALAAQGKKEEAQAASDEAYAKLHHDMEHFINEATEGQLRQIIEIMVACAIRAQKAGVDIIQVHGDRLVGSLCSPVLNKRTDEYGGSLTGRTRFAVQLVKALHAALPHMPIDYKLPIITPGPNGTARGRGGLPLEEAVQLAQLLEAAGVNMFHIAQANHTGNMNDTIPAMGTRPYGFTVYCAEEIRKAVYVPVCTVGRITTETDAEAILTAGKADLIGLGRELICDPDFANKLISGEPIRHCIMCNKGCTDAILGRTICQCVLNAENGMEYERIITPAATPKKVAVVGAGIAGMEAARVAAIKGHSVTLYEKTYRLGGQLNLACVPPRKHEMLRAIWYYTEALLALGVRICMGTEPSKEDLNAYDDVIIATGAKNLMLDIPGVTDASVISAWDVLAGKHAPFGKVSVIGGGLVGAETAEYLANLGCEVSIVEMLPRIAQGESTTVLPFMMEDLTSHGVKIYTNTTLQCICPGFISCTAGEHNIQIPSDFVVMAVGARRNPLDCEALTANVHFVGDCRKVADISSAVRDAYDTANSI
ncbi:MAG: NAD(P)/FAD-dependent oxidoreductase [Clostridia bacterium]|nr:NAD(P)/FAD-dependent oxidoreductase [Clostridia bacterium]